MSITPNPARRNPAARPAPAPPKPARGRPRPEPAPPTPVREPSRADQAALAKAPFNDLKTHRSIVYTFTPAIASLILQYRNPRNRPMNMGRALEMAEILKAGGWELNGETIIFDSDGNLITGQHRLMACAMSGVDLISQIVLGIDPAKYKSVDQGRGKTPGQILAMMGRAHTTALASTAGLVWLDQQGRLEEIGHAAPRNRVIGLAEEDSSIGEAVVYTAHLRGLRALLAPRIAAYCYWRFAKLDLEAAQQFMADLALGANLEEKDPVFQLRQRLIRAGGSRTGSTNLTYRLSEKERLALTIKAWNFRREGKIVDRLTWGPTHAGESAFPTIR